MSAKGLMKLIDIGANLTDPMFRGIYHSSSRHIDDFEQMLSRSKNAGIEKIIITGGNLRESREALEIAQTDPEFYSTVGCHPTRCREFTSSPEGPERYMAKLRSLALDNKDKVVALGEIGLDYDRLRFCDKNTQKTYFEKQLSLVEELKLPLFLHNRNSIDDFVRILEANREKFVSHGGVVHSFTGTKDEMNRILELGLYIGINGCSLKTEDNLQVVKEIPTDRMMIETDCPWCEIRKTHASFKHVKTQFQKSRDASRPELPVKDRNEPSTLIQVLEVLSEVRQQDIVELADECYLNTINLFFSR